jgi:aminomethyltransferase
VTSGSFAPTFGRPLAMAYVTVNDIVEGNTVEVVIRGRKVATDVVSLPFYRRGGA